MKTMTTMKTMNCQKIDTYRIVVDDSGIAAPPYANAHRASSARYTLHWGRPAAYLACRQISATVDGVSSGWPRMGDGSERTAKQVAFVEALESVFRAHGFDFDGEHWYHSDHGRYYPFLGLSVGSDGRFIAEARLGVHTVRYEIVDHASAQAILDAVIEDRRI